MKKYLLACSLASLLLLTACATNQQSTLFSWGDYQSVVYDGLEGQSSIDEQIQKLEKSIQIAHEHNRTVAPGLYAHLGMLYIKSGQRDKGISLLSKEKTIYPESTQYMNYLISQVSK